MQGYLPSDATGNVVFVLQEALCGVFSAYILYLITVKFKTSYSKELDIVKSYYLIVAAFVVAITFHPNLNRHFLSDFAWGFSQYLETVALLSQFILFNRKVT